MGCVAGEVKSAEIVFPRGMAVAAGLVTFAYAVPVLFGVALQVRPLHSYALTCTCALALLCPAARHISLVRRLLLCRGRLGGAMARLRRPRLCAAG